MAPMGIRPRATQRIRLPDSSPHRCMQIHTYYRIFSLILSLSTWTLSFVSYIYTHCCNLSVPLSSLTSTIPSSLILSSFHAYLNINDQPVTIFLSYFTSSSSSVHSNALIIVPFSSNSSYVLSQYSLILLYFSLFPCFLIDLPSYYYFFACLSIFFYLFQCPRCVDAILFPRFSPTQNAFTWGGGEGSKSWKDREDNRSSWERLGRRRWVGHRSRTPKAREFANLAKICLGQQLSVHLDSFGAQCWRGWNRHGIYFTSPQIEPFSNG